MLYLKCTAEIQKFLKLSKASLIEAQPSTSPLGNWYINRFKVGRRNCFIFMSENTYAAQATVDRSNQVILAADVVGSGSEQAMLLPMIEQAAPYCTTSTVVTADAGYYSDANVQKLKEKNISALIADNQMRKRDERFKGQDKHTNKPDPLLDKKPAEQTKRTKRFGPKDFDFNDQHTATCPAGNA